VNWAKKLFTSPNPSDISKDLSMTSQASFIRVVFSYTQQIRNEGALLIANNVATNIEYIILSLYCSQ